MEDKMHHLTLSQRERLTLTGVTEVISFDEAAVVLGTTLGRLVVQGQELQLKGLSEENGHMTVQGHITAMYYEEPRLKRRLFGL